MWALALSSLKAGLTRAIRSLPRARWQYIAMQVDIEHYTGHCSPKLAHRLLQATAASKLIPADKLRWGEERIMVYSYCALHPMQASFAF